MTPLRVYVAGVGFAIDGLPSWSEAQAVIAGAAPYVPGTFRHGNPDILPPAERRRAGAVIRLTMAVAQEATSASGIPAHEMASVFASSDGDGENVHQICLALASERPEISPTRFHNSVQNAAAGYWSIATRSHAPSNTVSGFDIVFATGLMEAVIQAVVETRPVLLVAYDLPMVEPLFSLRPLAASCGVGLVLSPVRNERTIATLDVSATAGEQPATRVPEPALEALRLGNPAARALPLLRALARGTGDTVNLELDCQHMLQVTVGF